mgnify:CR=1 FL=1
MSSNTLRIETLTVGQMAANCYLVSDGNEAIIIDPGDDGEYIVGKIQETGARLTAIVATHGHSDHVTASFELHLALGAPFYIHARDIFLLDRMRVPRSDPPPTVTKTLSDGDTITIGTYSLKVMHTPGHTPGGITLYEPKLGIAFVGDVLFAGGGVGRTDFSYSDPAQLTASIQKLLALPKETVLYPGHGEPTTVAEAQGV